MLNGGCKGGADKRKVEGDVSGIDRRQEDPVYRLRSEKHTDRVDVSIASLDVALLDTGKHVEVD